MPPPPEHESDFMDPVVGLDSLGAGVDNVEEASLGCTSNSKEDKEESLFAQKLLVKHRHQVQEEPSKFKDHHLESLELRKKREYHQLIQKVKKISI